MRKKNKKSYIIKWPECKLIDILLPNIFTKDIPIKVSGSWLKINKHGDIIIKQNGEGTEETGKLNNPIKKSN